MLRYRFNDSIGKMYKTSTYISDDSFSTKRKLRDIELSKDNTRQEILRRVRDSFLPDSLVGIPENRASYIDLCVYIEILDGIIKDSPFDISSDIDIVVSEKIIRHKNTNSTIESVIRQVAKKYDYKVRGFISGES